MIEKFFKTALRESGLFEGVQIHSIVMPQGYNYPAIIFNRISANDEGSKNVKVGHLTSERWSFGIYAKTISLLKQLESSVKLTFDQTSNESFNIQSIYFADTSSDFYDEEFEVYSVNVDFYVRRIIDSEAGDLSTITNPALTIFSKTYLITGTGVYNALLPLSGWAQPDGYDGNCAIVQFTDGNTVFYTYDSDWKYDFKIAAAQTSDYLLYTAIFNRTPANPIITATQDLIYNNTNQTVTVLLQNIYGTDYIVINGIELIPDKRYVLGVIVGDLSVGTMESNTEYRTRFELTGSGDKYSISLQKRVFGSQAWINADTNTPFEVTYEIRIYL